MLVLTTLGRAVEGLSDMDTLMPELQGLCARHIMYGVEMQHYDDLAQAALTTLQVSKNQICQLSNHEPDCLMVSMLDPTR